MRRNAIIGGVGALIVFILIIVGLYFLGDGDQSALERLRDIAIIFVVLLNLLTVLLLAAVTGALIFLVLQVKDKVIPLLEEVTGTAKTVRNTTSFISEESVRPIVGVAGWFAKNRQFSRVVTGKSKKIPDPNKL